MRFSTFQKAVSMDILLLLLFILCAPTAISKELDPSPFPSDFLFGTASSSYQVYFLHLLAYLLFVLRN